MDGAVRIWDLKTGECRHILTQHESLVALLSFSPSYLVSAAADGSLCVWNPDTGELYRRLLAESGHVAAITTFQHDETKVVSGSNGVLRLWDIRSGTLVRELITGVTGVWRVAFSGRWCVAAKNVDDVNFIDTWRFGEGEEDAT
jgi:F-box and WD-40 domain protein CDC4